MPNWVWQLIVALVVIVGAVIIINALGSNGAFN